MIEDLLPIGLLIVVAKLLECLVDRIGLSSIVAYTAAGILLGPVAGIVEPTSKLQVFLGIGVFILFFLVGLDEIDIPGFVATIRGRFFYAAILFQNCFQATQRPDSTNDRTILCWGSKKCLRSRTKSW